MAKEVTNESAFYVSDYGGHKLMDGKGKIFAEFKPFFLVDEVTGRQLRKGYFIATEPALIKKIEAFPDFNKGFKRTENVPRTISNPNSSSIVAGVNTIAAKEDKGIDVEAIRQQGKDEAAAELEKVMQKSNRFHELKYKLHDSKGGLVKGASDAEIKEFQELKILMGSFPGGK